MNKTEKEVIDILMNRDHMTRGEAEDFLDSTLAEVRDCLSAGDTEDAEDVWMGEMGLELDYLEQLMVY